jgi:hypothetical protein
MQDDQVTPQQLHLKAFARWKPLDDRDPQSWDFIDADAAVSHGLDPQRVTTSRLAVKWVNLLHRYETFWSEFWRPRENTRNRQSLPAAERHLGEWARYQRRFEDGLTLFQKVRLDVSPAFSWNPWGDRWEQNLALCTAFAEAHDQLPRLTIEDPEEFALARWLNRQLALLKAGTLPITRADRLRALLAHERR